MRIALLILFSVLFSKHSAATECTTDRYKDKIFDHLIVHNNVQYGSNINNLNKEQELYMDVFMSPLGGDTLKKRPVVLLFHGGAFVSGSKNSSTLRYIASELALRGYVAIPVQYRLEQSDIGTDIAVINFANRMSWYKTIVRSAHDIKGAIRYLKYTVAEENNPYGIDTNNITLYGSSAGAIGVLHATYLDDTDELSSSWQRVIDQLGGFEGNTSTHLQYGSMNTVRNLIIDSGALFEADWIGDKNDIDVLSLHHNQDPTVPFSTGCFYVVACHLGRHHGAKKYVPILQENGTRVVQHIIDGIGHPVDDLNPNYALEKTIDFLYESQCKYVPPIEDDDNLPTMIANSNIKELQLFPNPNNGTFTITTQEDYTEGRIKLFTTSGQQIFETPLIDQNQNIHIDNIPNGIYLLNIYDGNNIKSFSKIAINR